jgi:sporulation integral membrane protein YtvI
VTRKLITIAWLAVTGIGLVLVVKFLFPLLTPFILGLLFAVLIEPLVVFSETRLRLKRAWTVPTLLILLLLFVLTLLTLMLVLIYQEAQHLWRLIPGWSGRLTDLTHRWLVWLQPFFPDWRRFATLLFNPEVFSRMSRPVLVGLLSILPRFPQVAAIILLGVVSAYFFSRDKRFFLALGCTLIPSGWHKQAREFQTEVVQILTRFFRLECGLVLVTMILTYVCLNVLGINGALAYGLLAGFFDLVPILGPGLIYLPICGSCLLMGNYPAAAGVVGGYFLLLLIRQAAEFNICGADLQVHPLVTVIVIYLGMKYFGLMGFFTGPLLLIVLRSCYRAFVKNEVEQNRCANEEKNCDFGLDRLDRPSGPGSNQRISGTF